jgi:hypothetical protein
VTAVGFGCRFRVSERLGFRGVKGFGETKNLARNFRAKIFRVLHPLCLAVELPLRRDPNRHNPRARFPSPSRSSPSLAIVPRAYASSRICHEAAAGDLPRRANPSPPMFSDPP